MLCYDCHIFKYELSSTLDRKMNIDCTKKKNVEYFISDTHESNALR
jgi:hypothetical protein